MDWLVFIVRRVVGVSGIGSFGLGDIGIKGFEFMIDIIFVISVVSILWVKCLIFRRREFRIWCVILIIFFYILFMWEEWGGLNI